MRTINKFQKILLLISVLFSSCFFGSRGFAKNKTLLVISELDQRGVPELAPLYRKLESLAWSIPSKSNRLGKFYHKMDLIRNSAATVEGTKDFIVSSVRDAQTDEVDIIIGVHGLPGKLAFYDGSVQVSDWASTIKESIEKEVGPEGLRKLGFFYNLSCYGASHNQAFQDLGFKVVVGSRKVNANAEFEYPWVLEKMAMGRTVKQAFQKPNSSRWLMMADGPLKLIGVTNNNFLRDTDSYKIIGGDLNYRL